MSVRNTKRLRLFLQMLFDGLLIIAAYGFSTLSISFLFSFSEFPFNIVTLLYALPFIVFIHLLVFYLFGIYKVMLRYFGFEDFLNMIILIVIVNVFMVLLSLLAPLVNFDFMYPPLYISIVFYEAILLLIPRVWKRIYNNIKRTSYSEKNKSDGVIILGAGYVGERVVKEIYKDSPLEKRIIGFLDDDDKKQGQKLMGVSVIGKISDLERIADKTKINEIIIAINNFPIHRTRDIFDFSEKRNIKTKKFTGMTEVDGEHLVATDINIDDLLDRSVIALENEKINNFISGEVVLVTGGGGSIGSELCRQIADLNPKALIIFDIYENNAYDIQQELLRRFSKEGKELNLIVRIGSVYNYSRLEEIFIEFHPTLVFHAAAYKHVPLMEDSPKEALRTNVIGTYNTAELSNKYGIKKFILVSSDKAVRSTNVMGATKRFAEMVIQEQQGHSKTKYCAVRFGNVLGSNGSVIPLFKKQIEDGGPLTVTHPEITRFFMTIPEAVGLILQAAVYAEGGEIFVLDMGQPVKIVSLAEKMIKLSGLQPYVDIKIVFTGLRPGEKLYEELLIDINSNNHLKTENNLIFIEKQDNISRESLEIEKIKEVFEHFSFEETKLFISKIVGSYNPKLLK